VVPTIAHIATVSTTQVASRMSQSVAAKKTSKAHKLVLVTASKYFEKALTGPFQVRHTNHLDCVVLQFMMQESETQIIDMSEERVDLVSAMLRHICGFDYRSKPDSTTNKDKSLDALMYAMADKYDLKVLKENAKNEFSKVSRLEECTSQEFLDLVGAVYNMTPSTDYTLRNQLVHAFVTGPTLFKHFSRATMDAVFAENEGFAFDVVEKYHKERELKIAQGPRLFRCEGCHGHAWMKVMAGRTNYCIYCGRGYHSSTWQLAT